MSALLYGVGVGPGDPELMTLKAARLIREADVVFCPSGRPGRAHGAAAEHLHGRKVVHLEMEMRGERDRALREAAVTVAAELGAAGMGVYLTEGDPSLYSTFGLLAEALGEVAPEIELRVVPGVSSITAAAAEARFSLGLGDRTLAILPASSPPALLDDVLATFDTTVLLKPSMFPGLGGALHRHGLLEAAVLVREATSERQEVLRGAAAAAAEPAYFSTWLVPGGAAPRDRGRVHFVGAGPGGAEHLTRRALSLIRRADLVVAADSLVASEVIGLASGRVIATSGLSLEELVPPMVEGCRDGRLVVRLHSGDPSLYGAISEQMAHLREACCAYEVVPGVSSVFAAAAALGVELTEPGGSQTLVVTRHGRRVPIPRAERLRDLAAHHSTLAILLSTAAVGEVQAELLAAGLDPATPAAVAHRVSWPEEMVERTTVSHLAATVRRMGVRRHTLILVGDALDPGSRRSRLYDSGHAHVRRHQSSVSRPVLRGTPVLVAVSDPGERLARRLARRMAGAEVVRGGAGLADLHREGRPIIAFMAVGAAVRLLAPALREKRAEPPVVTVDDAGRYAVSLLGGRAASANRLCEWVASVLGGEAVITTAAERLGLPALDSWLVERGFHVADPLLARLEAAVVNREPLGFHAPGMDPPRGFGFVPVASLADAGAPACGLAVTDRTLQSLPAGWALARPRRLVLGLGCSTTATPEAATVAASAALASAGLAPEGVGTVATIDRRVEHHAVIALARSLSASLVGFAPAALAGVAVPSPSPAVERAMGTGSIAEAAALLASRGTLVVPKRVAGPGVTVAVAERPA